MADITGAIVTPEVIEAQLIESGVQGPQGPQGDSGDPGLNGADGSRWYTDSGAPDAGLGVVGDLYLDGDSGDLYEKIAEGQWEATGGNIAGADGADGDDGATGAAGAAGAPGSVWRSGTGAPSGGSGIVGDWYLNDANGDVYEKTGASTWTLRDNLTGPAGSGGGGGTPDPHAASHADGGSDEVSLDASQITSGTLAIARIPTGTSSSTVAIGNDARLSDARTPTAHAASHQDGGADEVALDGSQITGGTVPFARLPIGFTSSTVMQGDTGLRKTLNLSDLVSIASARTNLGLGTAAVKDVPATGDAASGEVVLGSDSRLTNARTPSAHAASHADGGADEISVDGSQVTSGTVPYARHPVGTAASTLAAGDDTRITGAAQKASNLSDLASASTARTNLGLGGAATLSVGTTAGTVAAGDDSRITGAAQKASNLSDLASASTARSNLGLGTAATVDVPASGDATSGQAVKGNDSRLTDARTPTAHASSHASAGSDPVTLAESQVTNLVSDLAAKVPTTRTITAGTGLTGGGDLSADRSLAADFGTASGKIAEGNDSRITGAAQKASNLSDLASASTARTNLGLGTSAVLDVPSSGDATSGQVVKGSDSRLTDSRTPTAHKTSHQSGGGDELALAAAQITSGTVATDRLGSGTAGAGNFLRGDQSYAVPPFYGAPSPSTSGHFIVPWYVLGQGAAAFPTSGQCAFIPIDIGVAFSCDAIGTRITTAQSGGTSPSVTLGLYADNGYGQQPDLSQLLESGTITSTSTGNQWKVFGSPRTLTPGRYWLACLYYAPSAPSTVPQRPTINNQVAWLPAPNASSNIGDTIRGLTISSLTALPSSGSFTISGTSSQISLIALRAA